MPSLSPRYQSVILRTATTPTPVDFTFTNVVSVTPSKAHIVQDMATGRRRTLLYRDRIVVRVLVDDVGAAIPAGLTAHVGQFLPSLTLNYRGASRQVLTDVYLEHVTQIPGTGDQPPILEASILRIATTRLPAAVAQ
jgi:hypothetical protein